MSRTLSGLTSAEFDDLDVIHTITIDGNAGVSGQVLTTDGDECDWQEGTMADDSITNAMMKTDSISSDNIQAGAVTNAKIGSLAVDNGRSQESMFQIAHSLV